MDLKKVLTTSPFPLDKTKFKSFIKNNMNTLNILPKVVVELKTRKCIVENTLNLLNLFPMNVKMLPTLHKLITFEMNKQTTLKFLKTLEMVLGVSTPIEVKSIKFDPLLFYDYLLYFSKSNNYLYQTYSLMCLHHLIVQHDLTVPSYIQLLYSTLTPRLLLSPVMSTYYDRLYKYIISSYTPLYASAAFIKKSLRLCLEAPTGSILIILNFILKVLYAIPQIHYLLHRPAIPSYRYPDVDPFETTPFSASSKFDIDLRETQIEESFLWEHLLLQKHPHPKVALLAQSFPTSEDDPVILPPELGIKDIIDPKVCPVTTTISVVVNPFMVMSNDQTVNEPSKTDCEELGIKYKTSLFGVVFD
ncbi:hypothetical protein ENUP19_0055G0009 [Entamoeba nuttalli]|uniref:CCAAT-binding factor domain-containing protein n=1 Tax=Entamoeba nuttalli TaxID=412467 RepID=A0ABQ0DCI1_9EUKA